MVATLFGPRLLYRFFQVWVTQVTIGLFMGTFIYACLCFLVNHQDPNSRFISQISLCTSCLLVVCSFAFLVYYSHRMATSIQNPDMMARVVDDLHPAFVGMHERAPDEGTGALPDDGATRRRADAGGIVLCPEERLYTAPGTWRAGRAQVPPGHFVLRREPPGVGRPGLRRRSISKSLSAATADRRDRDPCAQPDGQRQVHWRRVLAEQAEAIRDTATALVALDRHDLEAAYR
jgi:hypothetical protein